MTLIEEYEPELGQACFGQSFQSYECPEYVEAALELLACKMEERGIGYHYKYRNLDDTVGGGCDSAFRNIGEHFGNSVFEVHSYSWDTDIPQPYNFKYFPLNIMVSWYKYLGRGMSINREVSVAETWLMLKDCMESIL